jgi:DNA-binding HxlR family transcriptional regulator
MEDMMVDFMSKYGSCPMYYTISVLEGKWKWIILWRIYRSGIIRYNKLRGELQPIAHKTLSTQLKELEASNLILRKQYNEVPPRVEYSLTEEGNTLIPILDLMYQWGKEHMIMNTSLDENCDD